jgi:hypothetical protein
MAPRPRRQGDEHRRTFGTGPFARCRLVPWVPLKPTKLVPCETAGNMNALCAFPVALRSATGERVRAIGASRRCIDLPAESVRCHDSGDEEAAGAQMLRAVLRIPIGSPGSFVEYLDYPLKAVRLKALRQSRSPV